MAARILIGTCNWADHTAFYPPELERSSHQKERLAWYARYFPVVEVDSSFYGIPKPKTTARWARETPDDFVFNVKAFRTMTGHGLPGDKHAVLTPQEVADFAEALKPLRDAGKLHAVHYQFPPWATFEHPANREAIVDAVERHPDDIVAVEFRHVSWYEPGNRAQTQELLRELGATWVAVDAPQTGRGTAPPLVFITNPRLAVVRFHGRNNATWYRRTGSSRDRFDYDYSAQELSQWRPAIDELASAVEEIHVLLTTNAGNQGPANAYRMARVLNVELPPPPPTLALG